MKIHTDVPSIAVRWRSLLPLRRCDGARRMRLQGTAAAGDDWQLHLPRLSWSRRLRRRSQQAAATGVATSTWTCRGTGGPARSDRAVSGPSVLSQVLMASDESRRKCSTRATGSSRTRASRARHSTMRPRPRSASLRRSAHCCSSRTRIDMMCMRTRLDHRARRSIHRRPGRSARRPCSACAGRPRTSATCKSSPADGGRHRSSRPARRSSCSSRRPSTKVGLRADSMIHSRSLCAGSRRDRGRSSGCCTCDDHDHDNRDERVRLQHGRVGHDGPALVRRGHARQRALRRRRPSPQQQVTTTRTTAMAACPTTRHIRIVPPYGNGYYPSNGYRPPAGLRRRIP